MPPLLLLAAIGAGAYFGIKWANRSKARASKRRPGQGQAGSRQQKKWAGAENLKQDPDSGVYRVDD